MSDGFALHRLLERAAETRRDAAALSDTEGEYAARAAACIERLYPKQRAAVFDPRRLVAVLGTRRSGKSSGWLRGMAYFATANPESHQIYINTSRRECQRIAWRGANPGDGLASLNKRFELAAIEHKTDLTLTFPNGAIIELVGADDLAGIERALGSAPHRVLIDEAQKMPHLDYAIKEVLGPAMEDFDGQIALTGTPHRNLATLFAEITGECKCEDPETCVHAQWSVHHLSILDNPHFGDTIEERMQVIEKYCAKHSLTMDDPEVRRSWLGQWVKEDASFIYHVHRVSADKLYYAPARWAVKPIRRPPHMHSYGGEVDWEAALDDLPKREDGSMRHWWYSLGNDIGYSPDPFAWVLWAWSPELPELYEVASWKQIELTVDQQQAQVELVSRVTGDHLVGVEADAGGGGKLVVNSWIRALEERGYPVPINGAAKSDKEVNIELFNNDLRAGRIRLRRGSPLAEEMAKLSWRLRNGKRIEDVRRDDEGVKRHANDCSDGGLYAFRGARHHRYLAPEVPPEHGTAAWMAAEEQRLEELALQAAQDEMGDDPWD